MKIPTCDSCAFWLGSVDVKGITLDWRSGECRRRAPTGSGAAQWPVTDPDDGCGDHVLSPSAEAMGMVEEKR